LGAGEDVNTALTMFQIGIEEASSNLDLSGSAIDVSRKIPFVPLALRVNQCETAFIIYG
jgi:hypothetical protein